MRPHGRFCLHLATMGKRSRNPAKWRWDEKKELAAQYVAEGILSVAQIADAIGASKDAVANWKLAEVFRRRVRENIDAQGEMVNRYMFARKCRRLASYEDMLDRMIQVIEERGSSEGMQNVPGGKSGILVETPLKYGSKYSVDVALLKELRETKKQIAIEMGQWDSKATIEVKHGSESGISNMSSDERRERFRELTEKAKEHFEDEVAE